MRTQYPDNSDTFTLLEFEGGEGVEVVFDETTATEQNYDWLKFYKDEGKTEQWGASMYTGGRGGTTAVFPGIGTTPSLFIPANRFHVCFHSDGSSNVRLNMAVMV
jgi:hypothetical protein